MNSDIGSDSTQDAMAAAERSDVKLSEMSGETWLRRLVLSLSFVLVAAGSLTLLGPRAHKAMSPSDVAVKTEPDLGTVPDKAEGVRAGDVVSGNALAAKLPEAHKPTHPDRAASGTAEVYEGLGAWIDQYDFGGRTRNSPSKMVAELKARGVKTLFLQTGRWNIPETIAQPEEVSEFLSTAHAQGINVVGWYLPGFGNLDRDIARSLAVINFVSPQGERFDGFAPDIEDAREVGRLPFRFNSGIEDYSKRLRSEAPDGYALGAIVPDARNNLRAPGRWFGFPWPEIGRQYDVIMPMAYWTVTKGNRCHRVNFDVTAYLADVVQLTEDKMQTSKPIHPIGGIADCVTIGEASAFVTAAKTGSWIGMSFYDYLTTHRSPFREALWGELTR